FHDGGADIRLHRARRSIAIDIGDLDQEKLQPGRRDRFLLRRAPSRACCRKGETTFRQTGMLIFLGSTMFMRLD
ncbi:MAG TPA: hypothetical protein VFY72_10830, partial [Beijerinckiaceae bacterium]|nr:hypothetical protein [Beijerinckiaceae bacterium]